MKRNLDIRLYFLPLFLMMVALMPACKKNIENSTTPPVITSVRLYHASGKDTLLSTGNPQTDTALSIGTNKYVVIIGQNLKNATEIDFDGVSAPFNPALLASGSAVVRIPYIIYSQIDTAKFYTLTYKTPAGSTNFSFKLGPPAPAIYAISNVFANPGDSVYLFGANLLLVQKFVYGGTQITSFNSSLYGDSLGFKMPATTSNRLVTVTTKTGTVQDTIRATPIIYWISNENPNPGDSVYIYGTYFKNIQSLTFAGTPVTTFTASQDTKSIAFVAPALTQSGPVSITTTYGTGTTIYNVYTPTWLKNGVIENMDGSGTLYADYGGNASGWGDGIGGIDAHINNRYGWFTETTDFNGVLGTNHTMFIFVNTGVLSGGASNNGIILASNQWVPAANLTDAPNNWALKMEISLPKDWNGGALDIKTDVAGYIYRWEPWSNGKAYKTKGWITVTIPLSSFRASDPALGEGKGASLTNITDLVGPAGKTGAYLYRKNYSGTATTTGFYCAFDNIRIVKIK
ncbi:MAG: glycan-binding surface protein [Sphingobacteriales bacterium]